MAWTDREITKITLAVLLPPVAVYLEKAPGVDFLINISLTFMGWTVGWALGWAQLGWIPGAIHAMYIIDKSHNKNFLTEIVDETKEKLS